MKRQAQERILKALAGKTREEVAAYWREQNERLVKAQVAAAAHRRTA
jgi:hypothetical protein